MKLLNGTEVNVINKIPIDNVEYLLVMLPNTIYVSGALTKFVLLRPHEFVEHHDQVKRESSELTNIPKEETSERLDPREISKTDQPSN